MPDPDLLIRTSGEQRISNFLLWEAAYAELWFTPVFWPDFDREHLFEAIRDFQKRDAPLRRPRRRRLTADRQSILRSAHTAIAACRTTTIEPRHRDRTRRARWTPRSPDRGERDAAPCVRAIPPHGVEPRSAGSTCCRTPSVSRIRPAALPEARIDHRRPAAENSSVTGVCAAALPRCRAGPGDRCDREAPIGTIVGRSTSPMRDLWGPGLRRRRWSRTGWHDRLATA